MKYFIRLSLLLIFIGAIHRVHSQSEMIVNNVTIDDQREPAIAQNQLGRYVVVWTSLGEDTSKEGIFAQRFDANGSAVGDAIPINEITKNGQYRPAVALFDSGDFVVTWTSHSDSSMLDIHARLFDDQGNPKGNTFLVNTTTLHSQSEPEIASDEEGNFCIVWHSWEEDGGDRGIYGRCFGATGIAKSEPFQVNTTTAYSQANPAIAMSSTGAFVVAWESWTKYGNSYNYDVYAQRYNQDGTRLGDEFQVNTTTAENQWQVDVSMGNDASYIVVWTSWDQDGEDGGIFGQRYDALGIPIGSEFQVNHYTPNYQWLPKIQIATDNSFTVTWSSWEQDGDQEGVFLRKFAADGTPFGKDYQVNTLTTHFQWEPTMVLTPTNKAILAWSSWIDETSNYDVYQKKVDLVVTEKEATLNVVPHTAVLSQNFPNPFTTPTTIQYQLQHAGKTKIEVFDVLGRSINVLFDGIQNEGVHYIAWDGTDLAHKKVSSGIYQYRLSFENTHIVKTMMHIKE